MRGFVRICTDLQPIPQIKSRYAQSIRKQNTFWGMRGPHDKHACFVISLIPSRDYRPTSKKMNLRKTNTCEEKLSEATGNLRRPRFARDLRVFARIGTDLSSCTRFEYVSHVFSQCFQRFNGVPMAFPKSAKLIPELVRGHFFWVCAVSTPNEIVLL